MLINKRTKKIIAKQVVHFKSLHKIGSGLMFRTKSSCKDRVFLFHLNAKRKYSITMWFVFFAIDIILLDENFKVIAIKKNLKPFTHYTPKQRFKYMIEVLPGCIDNVKIDDVLEIKN